VLDPCLDSQLSRKGAIRPFQQLFASLTQNILPNLARPGSRVRRHWLTGTNPDGMLWGLVRPQLLLHPGLQRMQGRLLVPVT